VYDGLTARYTFSCPTYEEARVRLSSFRTLERLPGSSHPAVYDVRFSCPCGEVHTGFVTHDELDWAPLGVAGRDSFFNVMTGRLEPAAAELADQAALRIRRGVWPWSFFCVAEERPRPAFPSAFRIVAPGAGRMVVAVRCPACQQTSANVVSEEHLDLPFYSDRVIDVIEHVFADDPDAGVDELARELTTAKFAASPRELAGASSL
jgi:hypothetical protein